MVPVFNGAGTLRELVRRIREVLGDCTARHEIILVNDGSTDESWQLIEGIAASEPDVRGVDLARNYGQHNALLAGVREARCEVVVTIDDDLQNPPEEIPTLLSALAADCDVVYGEPVFKRQGAARRVATQIVVRTLGVLGGKTAPMVSSLRAFRTELRDGFADYTGPDVSIDGLLTWRTDRFRSVRVRHDPRAQGESNYSLAKLIRHALTMITTFSTRPLRMASTLGFVAIAFGVLILVYVLSRFVIEGGSVPGFPFLASIITIFSGVQLFAIGVIGEYLARVHVRVMSRPSYAIRARIGGESARASGTVAGATEEAADELCRTLEWDSEFWGFPIARVATRRLDREHAEQAAAWCDREGIRCAYLLADADDIGTALAAESVGFRPVDTRLTLERSTDARARTTDSTGSPASIRLATSSDDEGVADLARRAHTDTRFFFDTLFSRDKASELYATWVRRGLAEDSRRLLVAERDGGIAGYVLLADNPPKIDLIAVAESARSQGIGSSLVAAAIRERPSAPLRVVTQARNLAALQLYQASGFRVVATEVWYHRWR